MMAQLRRPSEALLVDSLYSSSSSHARFAWMPPPHHHRPVSMMCLSSAPQQQPPSIQAGAGMQPQLLVEQQQLMTPPVEQQHPHPWAPVTAATEASATAAAAAAAAAAGYAAVNGTPRPTTAANNTTAATSSTASDSSASSAAVRPLNATSSSGSVGNYHFSTTIPSARGAAVNSSGTAGASTSPPISSASSRSLSPRLSKPKPKSKSAAAMPGRPAKRLADGDDDGPASTSRFKLPHTDDFSSVVKNRLQSYTRTGQACDRCKVRKIRCDALPEGCSHCINLNLECFVTDRVTGRTERRGYMQELEREKNGMLAHISDLEKMLRDTGVEVKTWQGAAWAQYPPDVTVDDMGHAIHDASSKHDWFQVGSVWVKNAAPKPSRPPPNFPRNQWQSRPEQNHLGVGPDKAPLSSIRGTKLSLLGTTIDTTSFNAPDMDEPGHDAQASAPLYNKSVQAFLQSSMGVNPPIQVDFPDRDTAFTYAEWYFMAISVFLPVLHKPSFMRLLMSIYDEPNFKPSVPDLVIVHMVFSTIFFHCGVRNRQQTEQRNNLNDLSNKHYHYALSKIYHLLGSQELVAVQALALIALHTRSFPKPGCGSIVASMAMHQALELNLHRSFRTPGEGTDLQNELRKRTWWVILTVVVAINGRRGCPLPVNVQDFDTEFPEPIADELLTGQGVDTSRTLACPYLAGLAGFKIIPLFMEMYANIYSVRRDAQNYVHVVGALEAQLQQWEAELPESLRISLAGDLENAPAPAIYTRTFALELRLCLRHPSVAMTTDRAMMAENTRICEETAREFLLCMTQLYRLKSLDTTWYQMSVYGVSIFSMLVAQWERRFETTPDQVASLREDMQGWMTIVNETGLLLGCGPGISNQIGQIIERTIGWIEHDMQRVDAEKSSPPPQTAIKQEDQLPTAVAYQPGHASEGVPNGAGTGRGEARSKGYYQEPSLNGQTQCPPLAYEDQPQGSAAASAYPSEPGMYYNAASAPAAVPNSSAQPSPMATFVSQLPQHVDSQAPADMMWQAGSGNTWHDWTAAIADCQERYSANALLALGNTGRGAATSPSVLTDGAVGQAGGEMAMVPPGAQWPLIMFDHMPHG